MTFSPTDALTSEPIGIAIVGGGKLCRSLLESLFQIDYLLNKPEVKGVADIDIHAVGVEFAREKGIFVTSDYSDFNRISGIHIVLELTRNDSLAGQIRQNISESIQVVGHYQAMAWWDNLLIDAEIRRTVDTLRHSQQDPEQTERLFLSFSEKVKTIIRQSRDYSEKKAKHLAANQHVMYQILQGSPIPTFVIDRNHTVTHWNKALEKLSGYPADRVIGTRDHSLPFWKKHRPTLADAALDQMADKRITELYDNRWKKSALIEGAYEAEYFFSDLHLEGKWCLFTAAPIKAPDGRIIGAVETLQDTTEMKKAEAELERQNSELAQKADELKEREQTMAQIIQGVNIPIFVIDKNHIITHWNKALEKLTGYPAEEMVGAGKQTLPFWWKGRPTMADAVVDHLNESELDRLYGDKWKRSALIEGAYEAEVFFSNLGDHGKWCLFTAAPIKDPEGSIIGSIETLWDMTEKKKAEQERERHHQELTLLQNELIRITDFQTRLINSSYDGIIATDEFLNVVIYNPGAEKIFGYLQEQVVHKTPADKLFPADMVEEFKKRMASDRNSGDFSEKEIFINDKFGKNIPVRFSGAVLYEKNRVIGTVAFLSDLREIKRREKELVRTEKSLAEIGQTVIGAAHCIKNILHGFKGGSYLVNIGINKQDLEKIKDGWQIIQRNIARTSDLVMDLLFYSKKREPEYEPCRPNEIVQEICDVLTTVAKENSIDMTCHADPFIGLVKMDQQMVYRILLNLAANAVDACIFDGSEQRRWQVTLKTALEPNNFIRFEVSDNGAGMDDETQKQLFNSFFSTKGTKGTGLGLLVTQKLINEHAGTISFTTKYLQGSTFTVRLPFKP